MNNVPEGKRLDHLADQFTYILTRLDQLSARVTALENGKVAMQKEPEKPALAETSPPAPERVWNLVGRETLFSRIAAVCFILVFALLLRTITDNEIIDARAGTALGILYTFSLIVWGWRLTTRNSPLAPVFPVSGALLLFTVILESHINFGSLPTGLALFILFCAHCLLSTIGLRHRRSAYLYIATLGIVLAALSLDFPHNDFILSALLLLVINATALVTKHRRLSDSLAWTILVVTILFWLLWSFKLSVPLRKNEIPANYLGLQLFLPMLALYFILYSGSLLYRLRSREPLGFFHGTLPTIAVLFCYLSAMTVVIPWFKSATVLGGVASLLAAFLYAMAAFAGRKKLRGAPGCNAMSFAGTTLLAIALPQAVGLINALPVLSVIAYLLAILASRWRSGGVRLTSYLLQAMVCLSLLLTLANQAEAPLANAIASLTLAVMALLQYVWCRRNKPDKTDSAYFAWLDRRDIGAVILLMSGLIGFFGLFRITLFEILAIGGTGFENAFYCGQTIIINIGAIALMTVASRQRNSEVLLIAMLVVMLSSVKVFVFDLFSSRGLPLVISVFSFGIVALVGSLTVKRWQVKNRSAHANVGMATREAPVNGISQPGEANSLSID